MTGRRRLRRRLYLFSAPVLAIVLLIGLKMISVVVVGESARSDFARHDIDALESDVSVLQILDVIEPAKADFAAGDLAVLTGRLPDAEQRFSESLASTGDADSCPVRINLVLVRETLGDLSVRDRNAAEAVRRYRDALTTAQEAPPNCFAGNDDPDRDRRAVRADAIPRLQRKLEFLDGPGLPPPAIAPPPPVAPTPPPLSQEPLLQDPEQPEETPERRLGDAGDPAERLRILLDDANAYGDSRE